MRPTIAPATMMAPPTIATVAPVIPPPGIAIPQTLTRPPAIIQPIPGQPVVIPPPAVVAPTIVGTPVVSFSQPSIIYRKLNYVITGLNDSIRTDRYQSQLRQILT